MTATLETRLNPVAAPTAPQASSRTALDHQLTLRSETGDHWQFDGHHILCNGQTVEAAMSATGAGVSEWQQLSAGLKSYQDAVHQRAPERYAAVAQAANGSQSALSLQLKRAFDEKTSGLRVQATPEAMLLNGVNVRALTVLYQVRPTEKAKKYLEGVQSKLALILNNPQSSPHLAQMRERVQVLYHDLSQALSSPTIDQRRLPAGTVPIPA